MISLALSEWLNDIWGYSSAGRALEWHSRGQRFDPAYLHQDRPQSQGFVVCPGGDKRDRTADLLNAIQSAGKMESRRKQAESIAPQAFRDFLYYKYEDGP